MRSGALREFGAHYGGQHPGAVGINNGLWGLGAATPAEYLRKIADYILEGIAAQIQAPTLIPDAEPGIGVSNNLP